MGIKNYINKNFDFVDPVKFNSSYTKNLLDIIKAKLTTDPAEATALKNLCAKTASNNSAQKTTTSSVPQGLADVDYYAIASAMRGFTNQHSGKGFGKSRIKFGKGLAGPKASESMNFGHLYIDLGKLNNNILAVKYAKNGNKKLELAVSDATKMVILQMLLNKFTFSTYDKLTDKEKIVVSFLNNMLTLVPHEELMPNPIDDLYQKYNILRGEIQSGNDNPIIKTDLKSVAFQLHKYKKINSSQLRNLVFELDSTK
jgi:hypothetical protein